MKHLTKKGQVLENIGALGVGIATLTVILAILFVMMSQVKDNTITLADSSTISNESITNWRNGTAKGLSNACMAVSCSGLYNDSAHAAIVNSAAYSCSVSGDSYASITIINDTYGVVLPTAFLAYTCKRPSTAFNSTLNLTSSASTIPGWVALIVLISIGGIILALVSAYKNR